MLGSFLRTPSSFDADPAGFAINQAGHAAVGALFMWCCANLPVNMPAFLEALLVTLAYTAGGVFYAYWESLQWREYGGDDWDCVQDWAFVMAGALVPFCYPLVIPLAAFLLAGYLRRADG